LETTYEGDFDLYFNFEVNEALAVEQTTDLATIEDIPWFYRSWYAPGSVGFSCRVIEPNSRLYKIWSITLLLVFGYNLFLVPIAISFEYQVSGGFYFLEIIAILVYAGDIAM
jgi:hypothetical protein